MVTMTATATATMVAMMNGVELRRQRRRGRRRGRWRRRWRQHQQQYICVYLVITGVDLPNTPVIRSNGYFAMWKSRSFLLLLLLLLLFGFTSSCSCSSTSFVFLFVFLFESFRRLLTFPLLCFQFQLLFSVHSFCTELTRYTIEDERLCVWVFVLMRDDAFSNRYAALVEIVRLRSSPIKNVFSYFRTIWNFFTFFFCSASCTKQISHANTLTRRSFNYERVSLCMCVFTSFCQCTKRCGNRSFAAVVINSIFILFLSLSFAPTLRVSRVHKSAIWLQHGDDGDDDDNSTDDNEMH